MSCPSATVAALVCRQKKKKNRARFTDNTKNLGQACSGILVYFIELYRIVLYRIVKLKTKFTELKKANSQKQTYEKGELKADLKANLHYWRLREFQ